MQYQQGLLFNTDGSKGIHKAIREHFSEKALLQHCIWHKRENVLSLLSGELHEEVKKEYHQALAETSY